MKKRKKRVLIPILSVIVFLFCACGKSSLDERVNESVSSAPSEEISRFDDSGNSALSDAVAHTEESNYGPDGEESAETDAFSGKTEEISEAEAVPVASDDAILPNISLFLGKNGRERGPENYTKIVASRLDYETFLPAEEELLTLLQDSRYQLEKVGTEVARDDGSLYFWDYCFVYTGTNPDVHFLVHDDEEFPYHVRLRFEYYKEVSHLNVILYYCDTFTLEDVGRVSSCVSDITYSESSADGEKDCWYCVGSGKCPTCHGSGRVMKWVPGTTGYIEQSCTDCYSPGKCRMCGGSGRE